MSLLFVLFVVAAFATGVQAQDAADNENTTAGYAALGAGVALGLAAVSYTHLTLPTIYSV